MTRFGPDLPREGMALRSTMPVMRKTRTTLAAAALLVCSSAAPARAGDRAAAAGK